MHYITWPRCHLKCYFFFFLLHEPCNTSDFIAKVSLQCLYLGYLNASKPYPLIHKCFGKRNLFCAFVCKQCFRSLKMELLRNSFHVEDFQKLYMWTTEMKNSTWNIKEIFFTGSHNNWFSLFVFSFSFGWRPFSKSKKKTLLFKYIF